MVKPKCLVNNKCKTLIYDINELPLQDWEKSSQFILYSRCFSQLLLHLWLTRDDKSNLCGLPLKYILTSFHIGDIWNKIWGWCFFVWFLRHLYNMRIKYCIFCTYFVQKHLKWTPRCSSPLQTTLIVSLLSRKTHQTEALCRLWVYNTSL